MSYWDTLSMKDKAGLIQIAVKHGLTSLDDIRAKYNEFAKGGALSDSAYAGKMEEVAEDNYRQWGYDNPDIALIHALNDNTYDYKGYYRNTPNPDANASTHWPDTYKTAYHPTFSDESKYSGIKSEYNPLGLVGGHWYGDTFIPQAWQLAESMKKSLPSNQYQDGGILDNVKEGLLGSKKPEKVYRKRNTSSTSAGSTKLENKMYYRIKANKERTEHRTDPYDIPYGERELRVVPRPSRAKDNPVPMRVSVNALDSLAKYAGVTNTPIETALGLAYQETNFGRIPYFNYYPPKEASKYDYTNTELGNANFFKNFGKIPAEYLVRDYRYNADIPNKKGERDEPISMDISPLEHAFEFFRAGKYNPSDASHTITVKAKGKDFWTESTGNLHKWWQEEGKGWYEKGKKIKASRAK